MTLIAVLVILGLFGAAAWLAVRRSGSSKTAIREAVTRAILELRTYTRTYDLKCLVQRMRDEIVGVVLPSATRSYAPNILDFGLNPVDYARWGGYAQHLAHEVLQIAREVFAADRALVVLGSGRIHVRILEDADAALGRPSLRTAIRGAEDVPAPSDPHDGETLVARESSPTELLVEPTVATGPAAPLRWQLALLDGRAVQLVGPLVVGRDPRADLMIDDPRVSREHARFAVVDGKVTVTDLGTINGTFVNGARVKDAVLDAHDWIRFGTSAAACLNTQ